ncbi:ATP-binding cassette domain-containing protein [Candidatus Bathyarchaeota archaeon]|nr:ATP-binding cassette domain-containing protein [Candidatus Bathyarchaeota archaeon]MBS7628374.1 ATP-binding cassette domain-containing protein [Candidatus Bathyarchaeota archaeon]
MLTIEVQKLSKTYSGRQVLKDIDFKVQSGEVFVLVGPNGAGKTTLLRILDLLEEPTEGRILFNETPVDYSAKDKVALRRRIGMLFQQTKLFDMSVSDNIAYGLKVRGEDKVTIEGKVRETLKLVQLQGYERKNALTLSGGEAQRVSLAQALVTEPELLLLDEPTANLDPRNISIIEEVLTNINREKRTTIIMATHNMFQAENLAHRVAMINNGKIEGVGTFQEIFGRPSEPVKNFVKFENVFSGLSTAFTEGTSIIDIGDRLKIEAAFKKSGYVMIHIPPEDIILSSQPIVSSARNMFEGRITQILETESAVKLKVKVGESKNFTVQVTKKSFKDLQLSIGTRIFLVFKASSVQII